MPITTYRVKETVNDDIIINLYKKPVFWMLLECGWVKGGVGGLNLPTPSISPKNTVKNHFFDFLKVHNELEKSHETTRPLFSWRIGRLKKVPPYCEFHGCVVTVFFPKAEVIVCTVLY